MSAITDGSAQGKDVWKDTANLYAILADGPSNAAAAKLLARANDLSPFTSASFVHDNGCGPGIVISKLLAEYGGQIPADATLRATDFSPAMLGPLVAKRNGKVESGDKLWERLHTGQMDAHKLDGIADGSVSHSLGGLLYMLLSEPRTALMQTRRVLKDDGIMALSCWKSSQWMDMMLIINDIDTKTWDGLPAVWSNVDGVKGELKSVGFSDVGAEEVDVKMQFESHEQLLGFCNRLPHMVRAREYFNKEQNAELDKRMNAYLQEHAPTAPGSLEGVAIVAWARK